MLCIVPSLNHPSLKLSLIPKMYKEMNSIHMIWCQEHTLQKRMKANPVIHCFLGHVSVDPFAI